MSDDLGLEVENESLGDRAINLVKALNPATGNGPTVVKLLIYFAMCAVLLGSLLILIGNRAWFSSRSTYSAELEDVTGLFDSDSVRISGVPVGRVTGITTHRGVAVVSFEVDDNIEIPVDTKVGVRWRNVIGQKYLYLYPGESSQLLSDGARIACDGKAYEDPDDRPRDLAPPCRSSLDQADFGRFLNELGPILQALDPEDGNAFVQAFAEALDGNEQKAKDLLADAAIVTGTVGDLDTEIGTIIEQLEDLVTAVNARDTDLTSIIDNLGLTAETLADNNQLLIDVIDSFTEVQRQLRSMVDGNRVELDTIIDSLVGIGDTLTANLDSLDLGLSTVSTGLAPYHEISAQGQWFNVRARILCFAGQTTCVSEDVLNIQPIIPKLPVGGATAAPASSPRDPMSGSVQDYLDSLAGEGP